MIITVGILLLLTVATAAFVMLPRMRQERIALDTTPDAPQAFGYRMTWLAVRSNDPSAVAAALGITAAPQANWRTGIGAVYDDALGRSSVFVAPPASGWVCVVGLPLPQPLGARFADKALPLLLDLGRSFPDVQYFSCHTELDFFAWARVQRGTLVRAYAIGSDGRIWNKGTPTREERALGPKLFEVRGVRNRKGDAGEGLIVYPTEAQVMALAKNWSLDPTGLQAASAKPGLGLLAAAPPHWKPERLKRTA